MKSIYTWTIFLLGLTSLATSFRLEHDFHKFMSLPKKEGATIWALLVAGSNEWENYRHQADLCHAYQIISSHGIPDENIIVMMYDDIANNVNNPTPGIIINKPNGPDVYKGVLKDYTGNDVSAINFLNVLQGNEQVMQGIGSGRVIKSGPNDHVFVNFVDHGGPGILGFPSDYLDSTSLNNVFLGMYQNQKYEKLVFYVEACNSGSMFDGILPNNINLYVTTAANPDESSYACYLDEERNTYLGDLYSVNWMEDSDQENLEQETLSQQFQIVKEKTTLSHVQEYGQISISNDVVGEYQGRGQSRVNAHMAVSEKIKDAVPSLEVPKVLLIRKLQKAKDEKSRSEIQKQLHDLESGRKLVDDTVKRIAESLTKDAKLSAQLMTQKARITKFDCHQEATANFSSKCFNLAKNPYSTQYLHVLINMCEGGYPITSIVSAIDSVCISFPLNGIN